MKGAHHREHRVSQGRPESELQVDAAFRPLFFRGSSWLRGGALTALEGHFSMVEF